MLRYCRWAAFLINLVPVVLALRGSVLRRRRSRKLLRKVIKNLA